MCCSILGCLLVDEMNLKETYEFDKSTYKIIGFTDLGQHTPEKQKNELGNHALVIMYQPFSGRWIQPLGSFLSRGAASGTVLHQILTEAIILTENTGFRVNSVTTDGATWNRNMWAKFGVTEENISVEHITDPDRRLWFLSDFPHLIKNMRNWITDKCPGFLVCIHTFLLGEHCVYIVTTLKSLHCRHQVAM